MEADPTVEPELDGFSLILPLPYRIAVIFVLGQSPLGIYHGPTYITNILILL